ncbi:TPA: hypothetical protein H1005_03735 [archaeon]|uniref:Uncharacterized protein n=1 Tax=Candidatus Naiadarchaeum limnaeum TaxID=2756139 RepID=A0A832V990_9ARCH|nr:hypothetical protein [Candidatus Naiadarchaeales archaeon SRR2090153.bin1042]HIJ99940.1 hypothetical protein [Candidatus Naiadarchaeum limnaeum]
MRITSAKISLQKDSTEQIEFFFKRGKYIINILDDSTVSDFMDMNFVKSIFEEGLIMGGIKSMHFSKPVIISYKGKPLAEIYPDGRKKLHSLTSIHLGLRLLVHRIVKEL